ncbi:MAG: GMC family oxidoreductase N-terminal domain-containing protein [Pseudomonadales bacterium]|nr:GMC family oxidoreductase N-terminal domain-containing protein [Pseudomonadales bacterium]MCP5182745.1 GMC family oxidoreductase N-terminal domain-containing protein [Pseudomonadales bacterium]
MMQRFDVLIVGAGSSGSAIAARVSENTGLTVCLVEAGPDYPRLEELPWDLVNSHDNSYRDHDWGFTYEPTAGRSVAFPRGRVVGGSSAVNTTIALRGMPEDYDEWAAAGNPEWSWTGVLPAFCRLERDLDFGDADWHGDAGPITIRRYPRDELTAPQAAFLDAADTLGYPYCADANEPWGYGAGPHPMNKLGRLRISCAIGYLAPARLRPNLTIRADTHVNRLVIRDGRCTGVEIADVAGEVSVLEARLVVLAAGALQTPPVLMRSGIGPGGQLAAHGIDVISPLPGVGANLCDHPALSVVCHARKGVDIDHDAPIIQTILRYTADGSDKRNDLQIEQISFAGRRGSPPSFAIAAVLEYQYGRGELLLASADPRAAPIVRNRFCEDPRDLSRLVACYKDTLAFAAVSPLADLVEAVTFPDAARGHDDATLETLCRNLAASGYHPCGTAKMGPREDALAVVDQYGRCHGMDGLVVADASIMPSVPRANTNLTCIMIGEKVGEWLRTRPALYGL